MIKKDKIAVYIGPFLLANGFTETKPFLYMNLVTSCVVEIQDEGYAITTNDGTMYSENFNLYWLVGVLTWYNCIPKDYKNNTYGKTS